MGDKKSSLRIILHSIFGFLVFLAILIVANTLSLSINNQTFLEIVEFFNSVLGLFFILFLIGMINSLFWNFKFPLNLLAPISGGILGVLIVDLVYKILEFMQTFVYFEVIAKVLSYQIFAFVFFATLIIGYLIILSEENQLREKPSKEEKTKKEIKHKKKSSEHDLSWDDVGNEFRKVLHNIGKAVNRLFGSIGKPSKKKKSQNNK